MRILGLPGRRPETFDRLSDLLTHLATPQDRVEVRRYAFWVAGAADPDVEPEAAGVAAAGADLVVAWSLGMRVAMSARERHGLTARAWVFIGVPVAYLTAHGQADRLARHALATRTLFIQQANDPTGSFAQLSAVLPPQAECCELAGADHAYADTQALASLVAAWLRA